MKFISFFFIFYLQSFFLNAQVNKDSLQNNDTTFIKIANIKISGNKKTKGYIILREMQFGEGDSIQKNKLSKEFKQAKTQIYNTNLFVDIKIDSTPLPNNTLQVNITVRERWYIFPTPQFSLIDRSYKEWIKTYNADFKRVVYGVDFTHYNFSGRRDQLSITALNGYARNISFGYNSPYSNPKLTQGFSISAGYTQNREIGYKTTYNNKILAYKKDGFVRDNLSADFSFSWRNSFFKRTGFSVGFDYIKVEDSVISSNYNPHYFNKRDGTVLYPDFSFGVQYINTDKNAYPLKGLAYRYRIAKRGFGFSGGINSTALSGSFAKFFTLKHHFYTSIKTAAILRLPFNQAYINQRAIGFGSLTLRGLELFVIDGVAAATTNFTLSKKIVSFKIPLPFKIKSVPYIPFTFFAKTYTDVGYSYIPTEYNTRLNNRFLYTAGVGLDILSIYDLVFKIEYSFNQLGQNGLFLQGGGGL